jgi:hypothetical protein
LTGRRRSACHVARPCPSFVTVPWVVSGGERQTARPATQTKQSVCDGDAAGCYSHLLHAHAARRLLARAPREPRDRTSHKQTRAGRPADGPNKIKHSKAQLALNPTRFARFNARRPGTCGPDPSHSPRRVRRTCFASFDSYSSDIHLCRPHDPETANGQRHHDPKPSGPGSTIVRRHGELMQFTSHTVAHACRLRCIRPVVPCYCRLGGHDNRLLLAKPGDAICQTHSDAHVVLAAGVSGAPSSISPRTTCPRMRLRRTTSYCHTEQHLRSAAGLLTRPAFAAPGAAKACKIVWTHKVRLQFRMLRRVCLRIGAWNAGT